MNKVFLIGKLNENPEIKSFKSGDSILILRLVTQEKFKNKNFYNWHRIILYNKFKKSSKIFFEKGDLLFIEGRVNTRSWVDKNQNTRYITEIIAKELKILKKYKNYNNYKLNNEVDEIFKEEIDNELEIDSEENFKNFYQNEDSLQEDIISELENLNSKDDFFEKQKNSINDVLIDKNLINNKINNSEIELLEKDYDLDENYD